MRITNVSALAALVAMACAAGCGESSPDAAATTSSSSSSSGSSSSGGEGGAGGSPMLNPPDWSCLGSVTLPPPMGATAA